MGNLPCGVSESDIDQLMEEDPDYYELTEQDVQEAYETTVNDEQEIAA